MQGGGPGGRARGWASGCCHWRRPSSPRRSPCCVLARARTSTVTRRGIERTGCLAPATRPADEPICRPRATGPQPKDRRRCRASPFQSRSAGQEAHAGSCGSAEVEERSEGASLSHMGHPHLSSFPEQAGIADEIAGCADGDWQSGVKHGSTEWVEDVLPSCRREIAATSSGSWRVVEGHDRSPGNKVPIPPLTGQNGNCSVLHCTIGGFSSVGRRNRDRDRIEPPGRRQALRPNGSIATWHCA